MPSEILSPTQALEQARDYRRLHPPESHPPYSTEEYFTFVLDAAIEALATDNYGIGAILVLRQDNQEIIFKGSSTLHSEGLYRGHAEFNALELYSQFSHCQTSDQKEQFLQDKQAAGKVIVRQAPYPSLETETIIFTSLVPCIMCTGGIVNSRINIVVSANPDPGAGLLDPDTLSKMRQHNVAPRWAEYIDKQDMQVYLTEPESALEINRLSQPLTEILSTLYQASRPKMSNRLSSTGFTNSSAHHSP